MINMKNGFLSFSNIKQLSKDFEIIQKLSIPEIFEILKAVKTIFSNELQLISISDNDASYLFVGDTHGDAKATKQIIDIYIKKKIDYLIFLGDYVDRGDDQLTNINLILLCKIICPNRVFILRGNHETRSVSQNYGFRDLFSDDSSLSIQLYEEYLHIFSLLPIACIVNEQVMGVHGGLSENLLKINDISKIPKGNDGPSSGIQFQLLWNDPKEFIRGFKPSNRGQGIKFFGYEVFNYFMNKNQLKYLIRAHEAFQDGCKKYFNDKLISLFSCNYYGIPIKGKVLLKEKEEMRILNINDNE